MYDKAAKLFEIPEIALPFMHLFLNDEECRMLEVMERRDYSPAELCTILADITSAPETFIGKAYSRGVLSKSPHGCEIWYAPATFYVRLAFFAQYEPQLWARVPVAERADIDGWYVEQYMNGAKPRLEAALHGDAFIENASFYTLQETLDLIDSLDFEPYVVPCNCKSVAMNCEKPRNVCMLFGRGINSEWDRGHGKALTKDQAKELTRRADRNGLMHTSEEATAVCSCCGCCCYPIRASKRLGTKGVWPMRRYLIHWNANKCVDCGRCVAVCNFGAFQRVDGKIIFDEKACWGCTICSNNCPTGAISTEKIKRDAAPAAL